MRVKDAPGTRTRKEAGGPFDNLIQELLEHKVDKTEEEEEEEEEEEKEEEKEEEEEEKEEEELLGFRV
jgi:hypothetical protein